MEVWLKFASVPTLIDLAIKRICLGDSHLQTPKLLSVKTCELTLSNDKFEKGLYAFYPIKLSRFAEKKYSSSEIPKFHKGGPLQTGLKASRPTKNIIFEGSRHLNFMNPFEYGKSFLDKLFPKGIGTLNQIIPSNIGVSPKIVFRYGLI